MGRTSVFTSSGGVFSSSKSILCMKIKRICKTVKLKYLGQASPDSWHLNGLHYLHDWLQTGQNVFHKILLACLLCYLERTGEDKGNHVRVHKLLGETGINSVKTHSRRKLVKDGG